MEYEIRRNYSDISIVFQEREIYESFSKEKYADLFADLPEENKDIILNFREVEVVDSLFIGALIVLHKRLDLKGKKLFLEELNPHLLDIFSKLRLLPMMETR